MAKVLGGETKDLGGFSVTRILPNREKKMVGPFIFLDHFGPATFPAGKGVNVRPHPHIGLVTVSYLFEGSILHRDSLGSVQEIFPGDVNWMTAGKGIVHSERETLEVRNSEHALHGLQCWMALPETMVDIRPAFEHHKKESLPHIYREGVMMRVIAGEAFGEISPVHTYWPMFYVDVLAEKDVTLERPYGRSETGIYLISGSLKVGESTFKAGDFILLEESEEEIRVLDYSHFLFFGGEKFSKVPSIKWNFVAYEKDRFDEAERQWTNGEFPTVPEDEKEFIPHP